MNQRKRILALMLAFVVTFTSLSWDGVIAWAKETTESEATVQEEETDISMDYLDPEDVTPEDEIQEERTANKTVYSLGGNKKMEVIHSSDIRYKNEKGKCLDYDPSFVEVKQKKSSNGKSLTGYSYTNNRGDKKNYLPEKLTKDTPVRMEKDGYSISFHPVIGIENQEESETLTDSTAEESTSEETSSEEETEPVEDTSEAETTEVLEEESISTSQSAEGEYSIDSIGVEEEETEEPVEEDTAEETTAEETRATETEIENKEEVRTEEISETMMEEESPNLFAQVEEFDPVSIEDEEYTDAYNQESYQPLKAVYEDILSGITLEYQSSDIGIKENIVLDDVPEQNEIVFEFKVEGLTVRHNATDEGLTFYDKKQVKW